MAEPLRIEFPGALYHVMSRGTAHRHGPAELRRTVDRVSEVLQ